MLMSFNCANTNLENLQCDTSKEIIIFNDAKFSCLPVMRDSSRIAEYVLAAWIFLYLFFVRCSAPFFTVRLSSGVPSIMRINNISAV